MEQLHDLDTFAQLLISKGYNGYFHTEGAFPGKVKESISDYLEECGKVAGQNPKPELRLTGYLRWEGDDCPHIECTMQVKCEAGKFDVQKMEVSHKDRYGQLLKKSELANTSTIDLPKIDTAIAMVHDIPGQKNSTGTRRFRL